MPTRYYAECEPCATCLHQPEGRYLFSITGVEPGKYKVAWSNKTMKSFDYLKSWLRTGLYKAAGFSYFEDNYMHHFTAEQLLEMLEGAHVVQELDFEPC